MTSSVLPGLALLPAGLAVGLIPLLRARPALRDAVSVAAALGQTAIVLLLLPQALAGAAPAWRWLALAPGVPLELRADPLGTLFALVASALWVLTTIYSIGYVRAQRERHQTRYFACFALCLFATVGIAFAGNLLTFFVFFELLTVAAYPLVIHSGSAEARAAGRMYLAYTLTGGAALLGAVAWTQVLAGRLDFAAGGILPAAAGPTALWGLLALFVIGCGVKAALVPLHAWLPVAMIAPTPVSALLHAVAVVKAGVFGLVRVTGFVFGPELLTDLGGARALAALAVVTIVAGSLVALAQDNLKRLLAFSTVSQLSYVVLGAALGTPDAVAGGVLHIAAHAVLKITLFFCAGSLYVAAHVERVSDMRGVGRRMPFTMGAFALAAVLLAGLPPGAAFASKWRLLSGAADAGAWLAIAALLASTLLNLAYFVPIVVRAFAGEPARAVAEAPATMLMPLLVTAAAGLALGLAPDRVLSILSLAGRTAASVTGP
ncbi:MAG TPA: proton-conducting transporter membrane subunit [Methylomirabilota bacterium]